MVADARNSKAIRYLQVGYGLYAVDEKMVYRSVTYRILEVDESVFFRDF